MFITLSTISPEFMTSQKHSPRLTSQTLQSQILSSNKSRVLRRNLNFTLPQYHIKSHQLGKLLRRVIMSLIYPGINGAIKGRNLHRTPNPGYNPKRSIWVLYAESPQKLLEDILPRARGKGKRTPPGKRPRMLKLYR